MAARKNLAKYVKRAVEFGATEAKVIKAQSIVPAAWVRMKCQFGCGGYGQGLKCPPYTPTPEETTKVLRCYKAAILLHCDDHVDATEIAAKLEREVFLDGFYKALALGSGPCRLCADCNVKGGECRHPEEARPAMEACGIDVYQTARNNGYPIEVVRNHNCKQNYYSVVLVE